VCSRRLSCALCDSSVLSINLDLFKVYLDGHRSANNEQREVRNTK